MSERILIRSLVEIAHEAAPARKTSRRCKRIYNTALVALQIAQWIHGSKKKGAA